MLRSRLVLELAASLPGGGGPPGNRALPAYRLVAAADIVVNRRQHLLYVFAAGVPIDEHPLPRGPPQQAVERDAQGLAEQVPKGGVHGPDRGHGHGSPPPVSPLVEILPGVLDTTRGAAGEEGNHAFGEVGGDRELAAVDGGVPHAVEG